MPKPGDYVAYFYIPLSQYIEGPPGPYVLDIDAGNWLNRSIGDGAWRSLSTGDLSLAMTSETLEKNAISEEWAAVRVWLRCMDHFASRESMVDGVATVPLDAAIEPPTSVTHVTVIEAAITMPKNWNDQRDEENATHNPLLTAALDCALEGIRTLLLMFYQTERRPFFLPVPETLPIFVPYLILKKTQTGLDLDHHGWFLNDAGQEVHNNLRHPTAIDSQASPGRKGVYSTYLSLRNEADCLIHLGQYRPALMALSAAGESLVDSTLRILMWEDGEQPEDVAPEFAITVGVVSRARKHLPRLLKGKWGTKSGGMLRDWERDLVFPRNVATHQGTSVGRDIAHQAAATLDNLRRFLGGRVFDNSRRYPITSIAMLGELLMAPSGGRTLDLKKLSHWAGPAAHMFRLEGWLEVVDRIVMDPQYPRHPSMKRGGCIQVTVDSQRYHVWHDWTTGTARILGGVPEGLFDLIGDYPTAQTVRVSPRTELGPWVEAHNLVPGLQVLSDRDDIRNYLVSLAVKDA